MKKSNNKAKVIFNESIDSSKGGKSSLLDSLKKVEITPGMQVYLDHKQKFKKAILLVGPARSGKTRLANLFCQGRKSVMLCGRKKMPKLDSFVFSYCNKDTEVIVFDDFNLKKNDLEYFFDLIVNGITVHKKLHAPFVIHPQIIITTDCTMNDVGEGGSFTGRFDVFEITNCN